MNLKEITVHFAHPAYQLAAAFDARGTGIASFQSWTRGEMRDRIGDGDVMVCTGFWDNALLPQAEKLKFIQVCGAGYDAFDLDAVGAQGIRLSNSSGCNVNAVSDHAMALLLSLTRQIHTGRDNQHKPQWRGMISDLSQREDELPGKTMLIIGAGQIGARVAVLTVMVAFAAFWTWALFFASKEAVNRIGDVEWAERAEAVCQDWNERRLELADERARSRGLPARWRSARASRREAGRSRTRLARARARRHAGKRAAMPPHAARPRRAD